MWASWCKRQKTKDEPRKLQGYLCITWPSSQPGKRENMREDNESQWWTQYSHSVQFIKKKKKRSWQIEKQSPVCHRLASLLFLSTVQTTNSCVLSYSSSFLLFRGRTEELSLCHDQALRLILLRQFSLFLRSTAKAGFIIYNYKHKK